jgi:hypothetical protein
MANTTDQRLQSAIKALKAGKHSRARKLILAEVKENPSNLTAWTWALEVAANEKEKRTIIKRILSLDPNHKGALIYLRKFDQIQIPTEETSSKPFIDEAVPSKKTAKKPSRLGSLLLLPFRLLNSLPLSCGFIFLIAALAAGVYFYFQVNSSFFGLVGADFDNIIVSNSYEKIESDELYWEIQFEGQGKSKYIGTVRHVSPIRIKEFKILTHDILVTTADYSNPDIVETSVVNHKFIWKSTNTEPLIGSIKLIHAIPANKAIYQQLLTINDWDTVNIVGREIYSIKSYDLDETFLGTWIDTGCNTLLVDSVTVLDNPDR